MAGTGDFSSVALRRGDEGGDSALAICLDRRKRRKKWNPAPKRETPTTESRVSARCQLGWSNILMLTTMITVFVVLILDWFEAVSEIILEALGLFDPLPTPAPVEALVVLLVSVGLESAA